MGRSKRGRGCVHKGRLDGQAAMPGHQLHVKVPDTPVAVGHNGRWVLRCTYYPRAGSKAQRVLTCSAKAERFGTKYFGGRPTNLRTSSACGWRTWWQTAVGPGARAQYSAPGSRGRRGSVRSSLRDLRAPQRVNTPSGGIGRVASSTSMPSRAVGDCRPRTIATDSTDDSTAQRRRRRLQPSRPRQVPVLPRGEEQGLEAGALRAWAVARRHET